MNQTKKQKAHDQKKAEEKSDKRVYYYILGGVAILLIAIFSLTLFFKQADPNKMTYNGFSFSKVNSFWHVFLQVNSSDGERMYDIETRFSPKDLEYIQINRNVADFFTDANGTPIQAVYITVDPVSNNNSMMALAAYDLSANLARVLNVGIEGACTANTTKGCQDRPIIDCNSKYPVIYIKESNVEQITYSPYRCIIIEGKDAGIVKSVDRLLYQWYGVMY